MQRTKTLARRALLRGIGGVAVALPALEIMGGSSTLRTLIGPSHAAAQPALGPPPRYLVSYCGVSTGRGVRLADGTIGHADMLVPDRTGSDYDVKLALSPLLDYGVRDEVSVVSGLVVPWRTGTEIPPGGRSPGFHGNSVISQITGTKSDNFPMHGGAPAGPTSDQIVADAIAGDTRHRALNYRVQVARYAGHADGGGNQGRLSWRREGSGTAAVDPIVSPRLAYESLFSGFTPSDPADAERARFELRQRRSVLDIVRGNAERLVGRLGTVDRRRIEQHFDEIRTLENRLASIEPSGAAMCSVPPHPGDDPPLGETVGGDFLINADYSGEDERAAVLCDLVHMAFACDLSRSVALQFTHWKSYLNVYHITPGQQRGDVHAMSHWGTGMSLEGQSEAIGWHVKHLARLIDKLRNTHEVDGSTLLDHSALALLFEGGHGRDASDDNPADSHSTENMAVLLAGRAGGLRPGQHVVARDEHPANVLISAMSAVGVSGERLGDITGRIPALFG